MKRLGSLLKLLAAWCGVVALGVVIAVLLAVGMLLCCITLVLYLWEKDLRSFLIGVGCLLGVVLGAALFKPYCALLDRVARPKGDEEVFERDRGEIQ